MIRKAVVQDAAGIARVHVESWHETYTGLVPDEVLAGMTNYERRFAMWQRVTADDNQHTFVAVVDDEVIGFVNGGKARDEFEGYDGELYAVYMLKSQHGKGLGRKLVQAFAKAMLESGYKAFYLWVFPNNPTRYFYEHLGGKFLQEKDFEMAGAILQEYAYGWSDISTLLADEE